MLKRHVEDGELTAAEVMAKCGYQLVKGVWRRDEPERALQPALVNRVWEDSGPRALELIARGS